MGRSNRKLWFAEKFVSLLIEQHRGSQIGGGLDCCDLLKNSYLCLLNNTVESWMPTTSIVVICWKIRIFAYWTTPVATWTGLPVTLWFAEKFVSLLIEQHPGYRDVPGRARCDLLKNSYLCLLNNTLSKSGCSTPAVVICWKIRIFAYWTTPHSENLSKHLTLWFAEKFVSLLIEQHHRLVSDTLGYCCDLLKNSYLCLLNNTRFKKKNS